MEHLEKEAAKDGFFDFIKAAAPTIGKVVGGLINAVTNEDGEEHYKGVKIGLGRSSNGDEECLTLVNVNGRIIAYNTSLEKSLTLNFPRKLNHYNGEVLILDAFSHLDVTDNFSDCSSHNVERFNAQSTDPALEVSSNGLVDGIVSCVGYVTKKLIGDRVFKLTTHIYLQIKGNDLIITLSSGLSLTSAPSIALAVNDGAENKQFLDVQAQPEIVLNADGGSSTGMIVLPNAMEGYSDDDEMELDVTLKYAAPQGYRICDRQGMRLTEKDHALLKKVIY